MTEPLVTYVLSVACDERLQALRGEAAVLVGDDVVHTVKLPKRDIDGHVSWAIVALAEAVKTAVDAAEATKPDEAPPPSEPKRRRRQGQPGQATGSPGVSRSRRL